MTKYPHIQAAFINVIREGGNHTEACDALQKQWDESCAMRAEIRAQKAILSAELAQYRAEVKRLRIIQDAYDELLATVEGECPSLLNEHSGGGAVLIDLILKAEGAQK
jgi:hypothetical protein